MAVMVWVPRPEPYPDTLQESGPEVASAAVQVAPPERT